MTEFLPPSSEALAFAAGRGSVRLDAERYDAQTQQRVVNASLGSPSAGPADILPFDPAGPISLPDLAYLAGRHSVAHDAERQQDDAEERIVNATRGDVHPDPFGEITGYAWMHGDRIVYDERGGHEYIPFDAEE